MTFAKSHDNAYYIETGTTSTGLISNNNVSPLNVDMFYITHHVIYDT